MLPLHAAVLALVLALPADPAGVYLARVSDGHMPHTVIVSPAPRGHWRTEWYFENKLFLTGMLQRDGARFVEMYARPAFPCIWTLQPGGFGLTYDGTMVPSRAWGEARRIGRLPR